MGTDGNVRHQTSEIKTVDQEPVAAATADRDVTAVKVVSEPECTIAPVDLDAPAVKLPPAPQLDAPAEPCGPTEKPAHQAAEPTPAAPQGAKTDPRTNRTAPGVKPPPFLRAHESRSSPVRGPGVSRNTAASDKPKSRFPLLAATLAIAAGVGGAAGAIAIPALSHLAVGAASSRPARDPAADTQAIRNLVAQLTAEVGTLRSTVEQSTKTTSTHLGKLSERLERSERAQAEPAAKIAKIGEALERLERRPQTTSATQPAATGQPMAALPAGATPMMSVAQPIAAQPATAGQLRADITGSVPPPAPEPKPKSTIIDSYVLHKVFDGVALVEGRRGLMEVEPGSILPGAGRVEEIRRQDGRWVVVTTRGMIVPIR